MPARWGKPVTAVPVEPAQRELERAGTSTHVPQHRSTPACMARTVDARVAPEDEKAEQEAVPAAGICAQQEQRARRTHAPTPSIHRATLRIWPESTEHAFWTERMPEFASTDRCALLLGIPNAYGLWHCTLAGGAPPGVAAAICCAGLAASVSALLWLRTAPQHYYRWRPALCVSLRALRSGWLLWVLSRFNADDWVGVLQNRSQTRTPSHALLELLLLFSIAWIMHALLCPASFCVTVPLQASVCSAGCWVMQGLGCAVRGLPRVDSAARRLCRLAQNWKLVALSVGAAVAPLEASVARCKAAPMDFLIRLSTAASFLLPVCVLYWRELLMKQAYLASLAAAAGPRSVGGTTTGGGGPRAAAAASAPGRAAAPGNGPSEQPRRSALRPPALRAPTLLHGSPLLLALTWTTFVLACFAASEGSLALLPPPACGA